MPEAERLDTQSRWSEAPGVGVDPRWWLHHGCATSWYDGERFAVDHDVVLVSFNYRLGVLGFTFLAEVGGPDFMGPDQWASRMRQRHCVGRHHLW